MNYEEQKNKILTDFFNSGILKIKIDGYYKGKLHISRFTKIAEEIYLETLYHLSNYNAEKLVKAYEANPNSIEAIAVTVLKRQMMHKKPKNVLSGSTGYQVPLSPNNSFGTKLIFGSNYFSMDFISATDSYNEAGGINEYMGIPIADVEDGNYFKDRDYNPDRWEAIQQRLTPDEIEFITALRNGQKFYKRKPTNQYKEFRDYIFNKIKAMDLNKDPAPLDQIKNKLSMKDNQMFEIMFDEDLKTDDKIKQLKFRSKQQYIAQRRILIKKIKQITND